MRARLSGAMAMIATAVLLPAAQAADIGVAARKLVVVDKVDVTGRARTVFLATDPAVDKGSASDPDAIRARFDVHYGSDRAVFVAPSNLEAGAPTAGWRQNDARTARFAVADLSPTSVALVIATRGRRLKLVSRALGLDPLAVRAGPPPGSVFTALSLINGGETFRHCTEFPAGSCAQRLLSQGDAARLVCRNGRPDPDCTAAPKRVLVVGLDGGDWRYLQPLVDGGFVPALAEFQQTAAWGGLDCVPASPLLPCFCPIVWTSLATGWPSAAHGITAIAHGPQDRRTPAVWNLLPRFTPTAAAVALASFRNTWPPEPDTTWNVTEPGAAILAEQHFVDACPSGLEEAGRVWPGSTSQPQTWTQPSDLFARLGLLPGPAPQPPAYQPLGADRTSQRALLALLASMDEPPRLTMTILHHVDKTNHLACGDVTTEPFGDVDAVALQAEATGYAGPIFECPWGWGTTASSYMEADEQLAALLATHTWDYVVLVSDHGMTQVTTDPGVVACHHTTPPALQSSTFGIRGRGVRAGPAGVQSVLCVAPLLAYLLDVPVSTALPCVASGAFAAMLAELFTPAHLAAHPPAFIGSW